MPTTAPADKPLTKRQQQEQERQDAITELRLLLRPGDTVHTVLRKVSASGMSRRIDLYKFTADGPLYLTGYAATAAGFRRHKSGAVVIGGCGMDMGFAAVYELSRVLFPKGYKLPKGKRGRNGDTSGYDTDGGYALKQQWL